MIIGLGAGELFSGNIADLQAPVPPQPIEATGNGFLDWFTGAAQSFHFFVDNIIFFFTLMSVDAGFGTMGLVIFSPAVIILIWGLLKLVRGSS